MFLVQLLRKAIAQRKTKLTSWVSLQCGHGFILNILKGWLGLLSFYHKLIVESFAAKTISTCNYDVMLTRLPSTCVSLNKALS